MNPHFQFQLSKIPNFTLSALVLASLVAAVACAGPSDGSGDAPSVAVSPSTEGTRETLEVAVGPARQECYGPFRRMCLVVDGEYFYDEIDGFTHELGYQYRLRIERYDAWPGREEPPQDASRYGYRLLEVLEKTPAGG